MLRRLITRLRPILLIAVLTMLAPGGARAFAAQGPSLAVLRAAGAAEVRDVYVRPASPSRDDQPLQVLIALHGMGANGPGGADSNDADVPDEWDPYIGADRLVRARAFTQALESLGANVSLTVFQNADHTLTDDMRMAGCAALAAATT